MSQSLVPIIFWVGPSGADAEGATALLLQASHLAFHLTQFRCGARQPCAARRSGRCPRPLGRDRAGRGSRAQHGRDPEAAWRTATERLGSPRSRRPRRDQRRAPDHRRAHRRLDGKTVTTKAGDIELSTAKGDRHRTRPPPATESGRPLRPAEPRRRQLLQPTPSARRSDSPIIVGLGARVRVLHRVDRRPRRPRRRGVRDRRLRRVLAPPRAVVGARSSCSRPVGVRDRCASRRPRRLDRHRDGVPRRPGPSCGSTAGSSQLRPPWWELLIVGGGMVLFMLGADDRAMVRARFLDPDGRPGGHDRRDRCRRGGRRSRRV